MKHSIFVLLIVGIIAFAAAIAFAGTDYNSSISNSSTLSIPQINEQVGNILLRYNIGGAEINQVTDALAKGISEGDLQTFLRKIGIEKDAAIKEILVEFDKLGIASEDAPAPTTIKPLPADTGEISILSPAGVKKCGVNTYSVSNECGIGAFKNMYVQCYDGYEEKQGGESSCKSSEVWQKYAVGICANRCGRITEAEPVPLPESVEPLSPVAVGRCAEVSQWENKIAYYQKLANLSDAELKEKTGFSREEVERILAELPEGLVKVRAQCQTQTNTAVVAKPVAVSQTTIAEPIKPVVVESGQEISDYYKAKIENITSQDTAEAQIQNLQSLKSEIDELIAKLIKGRKEIEVSEFGNVVSEIKISRGEIKADDVYIKTTDKKVLFNPKEYTRSISIAPTSRQVEIIEIKDGDDMELKVTASEVSIKDNTLRVGNSEVKLAASEVAENLNVSPTAVELKEENAKAVYKMKVSEPRKLLGFIPIKISKTLTADAQSSNLLKEKLPWYAFLTTK